MACLLREPNGTNTEREEYSQAVVQMQTMNVHLRIGQYPESYERTRLPDEGIFRIMPFRGQSVVLMIF